MSNKIENCTFQAVKFDESATSTMKVIAEGVIANSEAIKENAGVLEKLANVFTECNVNVEAMVKFDNV